MKKGGVSSLSVACCLLMMIAGSQRAYAQQPYQFTTYTTANGLSDDRITCIYKDRTGYIWIGTENGLNRFDGYSFLVYRPLNGKKSLSHAFINDIKQDSKDRLWVATPNGLNMIDIKADTTYVFLPRDDDKIDPKTQNDIPNRLIWAIHIDNNDHVWLASDMRDLCYYDDRKKKFIYFPWLSYLSKQLPWRKNRYNSIRRIYQKSGEEIWLGTTAGLFSLHTGTGVFTQHPSAEADHFIQLQCPAGDSLVYFIQHPADGLQILNLKTGKKKTLPYGSIPVQRLHPYTGHQIWLPAGNDLLGIDLSTQQTYRVVHETDNPYSLTAGHIRTVYKDDTGLVWVGSDAGFSKFNPSQHPFSYYQVFDKSPPYPATEKDLFRTDHLLHTVLYSKPDEKYLLSSPDNNSLLIIDARTGQTHTYRSINGIPLTKCTALFEDSHGLIWILANRRAFTYDRAKKKFSSTAFKCHPSSTFLTDITEDRAGNIWISSFNDGIYTYDPLRKTSTKLQEGPPYAANLCTSLYMDDATGTLWFGTFTTGLCTYNTHSRQFQYFIQSDEPGKIGASLITDITKGKNGALWLSSYAEGVVIYDPSSPAKPFTHLTAAQGLPENNVYSLAADGNGHLWGTTFSGLFAIDERSRHVSVYNRKQGLGFTDFHAPFTRSKNGMMITAVSRGFVSFRGDSLVLPSDDFNVVINLVKTIAGREFYGDTHPKDIHLAFDDNELDINFAGLSYHAPELTTYDYRLEGFEKQWHTSNHATNVRYSHLPPGYYVFNVKATDYSGRKSVNQAQFAFCITPPWWQTWWFRLLIVALLILAGIFAYSRRIAHIQKKAAVQLQIQELKEQALRSQMNPHFIFNCLNAIQELILTENYSASHQYLSKFSKLMRLVLHASEKNLLPLYKEIEINRLYIELESLRFKHLFRYDIHLSSSVDAESTLFPTLLLQPFIENAIRHGLLQKEGMKELKIAFEESGERLVCTIADNGIGREKAMAIRMNKLGHQHTESKGIQMARQRLETLELAGNGIGSIRISDRLDSNGHVAGTEVEITIIPFEK